MNRRERLARLRAAWGAVRPAPALDDPSVTEAWELASEEGRVPTAVDGRTWSDLQLDRVFSTIDRTLTTLGRQQLYRRLRSGLRWREQPAMEALTTGLGTDRASREKAGLALAAAGPALGRGFWLLTRPDAIQVRFWYRIIPLLAVLTLASVIAIPLDPRALVPALALVVMNMLVRAATDWQVPGLLAALRQAGPLLRTANRLLPIPGTAAVGPTDIALVLRRLRPLGRLAAWVGRDPLASGELAASLWEYLNLLFLLDANALWFGARHLRTMGPALARIAVWVGDIDVARSVASLRAEPRPWARPEWTDDAETRALGLWHPLVQQPVANDAVLHPGRGLLVTGANMSGKSTYLRTVGVAAVLARAIETCPGTSWSGRAFRVRSLIGRQDDLEGGKSYYQVEAEAVIRLLHEARDDIPTLFLLDELLRGTNTVERLAAGEAILRALPEGRGEHPAHAVVAATHDDELVALVRDLYAPVHFEETIGTEGFRFDYRLREGPARTRTAIALLEAGGAPVRVTASARERANELDAPGGLAALRHVSAQLTTPAQRFAPGYGETPGDPATIPPPTPVRDDP